MQVHHITGARIGGRHFLGPVQGILLEEMAGTRGVILALAVALVAVGTVAGTASNAASPLIGAIRWDAWSALCCSRFIAYDDFLDLLLLRNLLHSHYLPAPAFI